MVKDKYAVEGSIHVQILKEIFSIFIASKVLSAESSDLSNPLA